MAIPANVERVLVDKVKATFRDAVVETSVFKDEVTHVVEKRALRSVCTFFKTDPETKMNFLADVVGVDYLPRRPRFEVVYHMYSTIYKFRVRVKVRLEEGETVDSVTSIWAGADWAEREVYDMFGIVFDGHPNMRRIYLADDWEGYPLRKDYPLRGYRDRYNPFGVEKK